jgi:hypothetical protein
MKHKTIVIALISIFLAFLSYHFLFFWYHPSSKVDYSYLEFFKDSIRYKLDTTDYSIYRSKSGKITYFYYYEDDNNRKPFYDLDDTTYNNYNIAIWEFNKNYYFNDVIISTSVGHYKPDFWFYDKIGNYNPISIQYFFRFNGMRIYPFDGSEITQTYNEKNYKGFYGLLNGILICDKNDKPKSYIEFAKNNSPTIVLVYNLNDKICLTWINATKRLDSSIINTLNFK